MSLEISCRPGTQDLAVIDQVLNGDEYAIPALEPDKVVIDVGANIGCFALACMRHGATWVRCVEPHPDNVRLLRKNLAAARCRDGAPLVYQIDEAAVWSDALPKARLFDHGRRTAMHTLCQGGSLDVKIITLERLLENYKEVQLLKLDCEGGEWPALLLTAPELLRRCRHIMGEIHLSLPAPGLPATEEAVAAAFARANFHVAFFPDANGSTINKRFYARRRP